MMDLAGKVVIAVTDTGGVAYDAAFLESPRVITGTVARTYKHRGLEPALRAVRTSPTGMGGCGRFGHCGSQPQFHGRCSGSTVYCQFNA